MSKHDKREVWQRGPIKNVPALLQPVAHALLQAREEVNELMLGFPDTYLWERPAGAASAGFHLQHLTGVLDRLFTYAFNKQLNEDQLASLAAESQAAAVTVQELVERFNEQVDKSLEQLKLIDERTLTEARGVGRAQIPSTVIGLLVHSAEHTMRHVGQLLVTVKVLQATIQ
jgi:uncharacterized damage-inducible protein DinB